MFAVNLGGEGEIPGVINQQGPWILSPNWFCSRDGRTFPQLVNDGHVFLICPNIPLPFPDGTFDVVYTNGVPLDMLTPRGPGVQSSEIRRILKSGGQWIKDGNLEWTKP
jgi:SAM-dependent methyltransferase